MHKVLEVSITSLHTNTGSFGFDFDATYTAIHPGETFTYQFGDRFATATLQDVAGTNSTQTRLTITFDAETINPIELQQQGWQAILDRFKGYVEGR